MTSASLLSLHQLREQIAVELQESMMCHSFNFIARKKSLVRLAVWRECKAGMVPREVDKPFILVNITQNSTRQN